MQWSNVVAANREILRIKYSIKPDKPGVLVKR